jgi:hypothetical protein
MNPGDMRALAASFSSELTAARVARQDQNLLAIAENLEAALTAWQVVASVTEAFRALKIDLSAIQGHIDLLKQNPQAAAQELVRLPADALAQKGANTFSEYAPNAYQALQLVRERWTSWSNEALASLSVLEPVLDRILAVASLKPKIVALKRERRAEPPSSADDVKAIQDWLKRCEELSSEANRCLDPGIAAFIKDATKGDGIWLDRVAPTTLDWIFKHDFARFLRVKFHELPNPNPAPKAPSQPTPATDEDDWP